MLRRERESGRASGSFNMSRRFYVQRKLRPRETISVMKRLAVTNDSSAASQSPGLWMAPPPTCSPLVRLGGGGPTGLADVPRPPPCLIRLGSVVSDAAKLGFSSAARLGKLPADADPPAVYHRKKWNLSSD